MKQVYKAGQKSCSVNPEARRYEIAAIVSDFVNFFVPAKISAGTSWVTFLLKGIMLVEPLPGQLLHFQTFTSLYSILQLFYHPMISELALGRRSKYYAKVRYINEFLAIKYLCTR